MARTPVGIQESTMMVCSGEALIDLLPTAGEDDHLAFHPLPGGSPFNVAVALGRLEAPVAFLGPISTDTFGERLMRELAASGVITSLVCRVQRPTPLAVVTLGDRGEPHYAFYDRGTALRDLTLGELVSLPGETTVVHFGSIALAADPAASTLIAKVAGGRQDRLISFDPNVRPGFVTDEADYRRHLDAALALADIVRLSEADLAWLRPGIPIGAFARERLDAGASLIAVTNGPGGARGFVHAGEVSVPAVPVTVADTIGAGDAFTAGLLLALHAAWFRTRGDLQNLNLTWVEAALAFAGELAAIACSQPGADPPRKNALPPSAVALLEQIGQAAPLARPVAV